MHLHFDWRNPQAPNHQGLKNWTPAFCGASVGETMGKWSLWRRNSPHFFGGQLWENDPSGNPTWSGKSSIFTLKLHPILEIFLPPLITRGSPWNRVVFQTKRDPDDAFHRGHPLSFWQQFLALAQNHCGQLQPSSGSGHPQGRIQWWIRFYESISSPSLTLQHRFLQESWPATRFRG